MTIKINYYEKYYYSVASCRNLREHLTTTEKVTVTRSQTFQSNVHLNNCVFKCCIKLDSDVVVVVVVYLHENKQFSKKRSKNTTEKNIE